MVFVIRVDRCDSSDLEEHGISLLFVLKFTLAASVGRQSFVIISMFSYVEALPVGYVIVQQSSCQDIISGRLESFDVSHYSPKCFIMIFAALVNLSSNHSPG